MHKNAVEFLELYEQGMTQTEIGAKFGRTQSGVGLILRSHPRFAEVVRSNGKPRRPDGLAEQVISLYTVETIGLNAIARRVNIKNSSVKKILLDAGIEIRSQSDSQRGKNNPCWGGGRRIDKDGYIMIFSPNHPYCRRNKTVLEHRLVMESKIGRYLLPHEVVHHKDDNKQNNDPLNLELFGSNGEHLAETLTGKPHKVSEENRRKISEAVKSRWRSQRAKTADQAAISETPHST